MPRDRNRDADILLCGPLPIKVSGELFAQLLLLFASAECVRTAAWRMSLEMSGNTCPRVRNSYPSSFLPPNCSLNTHMRVFLFFCFFFFAVVVLLLVFRLQQGSVHTLSERGKKKKKRATVSARLPFSLLGRTIALSTSCC
jgi:hypothetical protein